MTTRLRRAALAVLAVLVAVLALGVGTASAHVTVSSPDAAPGGFAEVTFSVPSESYTAKTTSLKVQLPTDTPFAFVSVQPVTGWTATTTTTPINPPLTDDDGNQLTQAVSAWIDPTVEGQPEPEHPAPTLTLAAAAGDGAAPTTAGTDDGGSGVAVTALVLAILGLVAGLAGLALALTGGHRAPRAAAPDDSRNRDTASV